MNPEDNKYLLLEGVDDLIISFVDVQSIKPLACLSKYYTLKLRPLVLHILDVEAPTGKPYKNRSAIRAIEKGYEWWIRQSIKTIAYNHGALLFKACKLGRFAILKYLMSLVPSGCKLLFDNFVHLDRMFKLCASSRNTDILEYVWSYDQLHDKELASPFVLYDCLLAACKHGSSDMCRKILGLAESLGFRLPVHSGYEKAFRMACQYGHDDIAEWLVLLENKGYGKIDIHKRSDDAFRSACMNGHQKTAEWLIAFGEGSKSRVNIHAVDDFAFILVCNKGYDQIAKWLIGIGEKSYGKIDIRFINHAFQEACTNGHDTIAKWLISLEGSYGEINIHSMGENAFRMACMNGHHTTAKWLISLEESRGRIDIHISQDFAFNRACANGHDEIAAWIFNMGEQVRRRVDIESWNNEAFVLACRNGHHLVVKLLFRIAQYYFPEVFYAGMENEYKSVMNGSERAKDFMDRLLLFGLLGIKSSDEDQRSYSEESLDGSVDYD